MYFEYQKERDPNFNVLKKDYGFATYKYMDLEGTKAVYIEDIYVQKGLRKEGYADKMSYEVQDIARNKGVKWLLGSVDSTLPGATTSLKILLSHGMNILKSENNFIWFYKQL